MLWVMIACEVEKWFYINEKWQWQCRKNYSLQYFECLCYQWYNPCGNSQDSCFLLDVDSWCSSDQHLYLYLNENMNSLPNDGFRFLDFVLQNQTFKKQKWQYSQNLDLRTLPYVFHSFETFVRSGDVNVTQVINWNNRTNVNFFKKNWESIFQYSFVSTLCFWRISIIDISLDSFYVSALTLKTKLRLC